MSLNCLFLGEVFSDRTRLHLGYADWKRDGYGSRGVPFDFLATPSTYWRCERLSTSYLGAPEPYYTFYRLALEPGARAGELCGLRSSDFDFERRTAVESSPATIGTQRSFTDSRRLRPRCERRRCTRRGAIGRNSAPKCAQKRKTTRKWNLLSRCIYSRKVVAGAYNGPIALVVPFRIELLHATM
jgi:integrase